MVHLLESVSPSVVVPGVKPSEAEGAMLWDDVEKRSFYVVVWPTGKAYVEHCHVGYSIRGVESIAVFVSTINQMGGRS